MTPLAFFAVALALVVFSLVSKKAERGVVTPPMVFAGLGFALGAGGFGLLNVTVPNAALNTLAEVTLALTLYTDASRIDPTRLGREHDLPLRLLGVGLPLTMLAGFGLALVLLPAAGLVGAALLAIALAPTDAALGQAVVSNEAVPPRISQAINVESGLNDGLAFPALVVLASFATEEASRGIAGWLGFLSAQIVLGPLVGLAVGYVGARLIEAASEHGDVEATFLRLGSVALAILAYAGAECIGGNGFLAAFAGGLMAGARSDRLRAAVGDFAEAEGQLRALIVFLLFGAVLLPSVLGGEAGEEAEGWLDLWQVGWPAVAYALLSLTVVRMVPVALCLIGARLRPSTVLFVGWFGPRGLASIIYLLILLDEYALDRAERIAPTVLLTVALSIVLHGVTAAPLARAYGRAMKAAEERKPVSGFPTKTRPASLLRDRRGGPRDSSDRAGGTPAAP